MKFEAIAVENIPLIHAGDNLSSIICENIELQDMDIVIVASTVVAKAEGEIFRLEDITPEKTALEIAARNGRDARFIQAVVSRSREIPSLTYVVYCRPLLCGSEEQSYNSRGTRRGSVKRATD